MMQKTLAIVQFALSLCQLAFGQFDSATVLGRIQDASGGGVPANIVKLESIQAGVSVQTLSDSSGSFEFAEEKIGHYLVSAEKPGFSEGSRIEFRAEFFNLLNRSNFTAPSSSANSSSFGTITSTFPARQIQFALKLYYLGVLH